MTSGTFSFLLYSPNSQQHKLLSLYLSSFSHNIHWVKDRFAFEESVRDGRFDIVIIDSADSTCHDMIGRMRLFSNHPNTKTPVIVLESARKDLQDPKPKHYGTANRWAETVNTYDMSLSLYKPYCVGRLHSTLSKAKRMMDMRKALEAPGQINLPLPQRLEL